MILRKLLAGALAAALLVGCHPSTPPPAGGEDCVAACQHLGPEGLNCPAFGPVPGPLGKDGTQPLIPCTTWLCGSRGIRSECLVRASSCPEADRVQESGCAR